MQGNFSPVNHTVKINAALPSGLYLVKITPAGGSTYLQKVMIER